MAGKGAGGKPYSLMARLAYTVCFVKGSMLTLFDLQKKKNTLSGTEFQRAKEAQAAIMRQKQEAGE